MLVSTKNIFKKCYGKYEIAAVNVWDMEQIHGFFREQPENILLKNTIINLKI